MKRIEITKEYEGEIVYGVPTGNNAVRCPNRSKPVEFIVIKRKIKYVALQRVGFPMWVDNYDPVTDATQSAINSGYGINAGYEFYASLEDIENMNELKEKRRKIRDYFGGTRRLLDFDEVELDTILNILSKKRN